MNKMFDTQMRHAPILLALNIIEQVTYKIFNKHPNNIVVQQNVVIY